MEAAVDQKLALKFLDTAQSRVGGYLVVWGSPEQRDLQGEYFTKETQFYLDWFERRPMLFHHGLDGVMKSAPVGVIDTIIPDDTGLWAEAELDIEAKYYSPDQWEDGLLNQRKEYVARVQKLIQRGVLGWSSGSIPHLVETSNDGHIRKWPIVEGSATPTPAEPRMTDIGILKAIKGIENIINLKALEAKADDDATITEDGSGAVDVTVVPPVGEVVIIQTDNTTPAHEAGRENLTMFPPQEQQQQAQAVAMMPPIEEPAKMQEQDMANAKSSVESYVGLTAQMLGIQLSPEELQGLINQVYAATQERVGTTAINAVNVKAAFDDPAFCSAVVNRAKAVQAAKTPAINMDAMRATVQGMAGAGGASLIGNGGHSNGVAPAAKATTAANISEVRDLKYDSVSPADLIFGAHVMNTAAKAGQGSYPSQKMLRAAAERGIKAAESSSSPFGRQSFAVKALMERALKADEVIASNLANSGANWVGDAYDTQVWESVRIAPIYRELISMGMMEMTIPEGMDSIYIPTEGSDPVYYSLVELNDLTTDERLPITGKMSTPTLNRRQITAGFVGARVAFSDVMEEDSLIPLLPFYRNSMEISAQEQIESIMINGDTDTTATTNLNLIDGTPTVDAKGRGPAYLATNGFLKLPLITTTSLSRDASTTLDETDFLNTIALLPKAQRANRNKLVFILDTTTHLAALNIPSVKTRDVFSPATLQTGYLARMYNVPVKETGFMELANSAGKISATPGNNTRGRILCLRPDQWAVGWKRQVRTESARDIDAQATVIVSTLRFGMQYRASDGGAAVSYNVAVA